MSIILKIIERSLVMKNPFAVQRVRRPIFWFENNIQIFCLDVVVRRRRKRDIHISRKLHEKGISIIVGSSSSSEGKLDKQIIQARLHEQFSCGKPYLLDTKICFCV